MVLRKPYAFLIKHFKLIHLLLCIPLVYLLIRSGAIVSFFSDYVRANYYTNLTNIPGKYINLFMYLAIIFILLLVLAVFFLMRQKKKDTKFYLFLLIYYIALFILLTVVYGLLDTIESGDVTAQVARTYRDVSVIFYLPQFYFLIYSLLRGIGFDIKKFNFEEDAKELEISDLDNEEFELVLGKDTYKYKRTFRRFFREFKYYVLENKITFSILMVIVISVLGTLVYLHFGVYNKTYKQTQKINHNNLIVSVSDSVLSNFDNGGKIIDDKYYLAVAMKIKNTSKENKTLDYEHFKIEIQNRSISATLDRTGYFVDLGIPYTRDTQILPGTENTYVLTYEIPLEFINSPMELKILESLTYDIGSVSPSYKTIQLNYEKAYETEEVQKVLFHKVLDLSGTRLDFTQIRLNGYEIMKSYEYQYQSCVQGSCQNLKSKVSANSRKTLIVIDRMFQLDRYSIYYQASKKGTDFANQFLMIRYSLNDSVKTVRVKDVTPKELDNVWVFEVDEEISYQKNLELLVNLRGKIYTMEMQ